MKIFSGRIVLFLTVLLLFLAGSVSAQKHKTEQDQVDKIEKVEIEKAPDPPVTDPPPPARNDPDPGNTPPPSNNPPSDSNRGSDNGSDNGSSNDRRGQRHRRGNRGSGDDDETRHRKHRDNDDDRKRNRRRRDRDFDTDPGYTVPVWYPAPSPGATYSSQLLRSFGSNDVIMPVIRSYRETDPGKYLPFYDANLTGKYEPLYYSYLFEYYLGSGFQGYSDWLFYYEPDLENVFVNFPILGGEEFDRVILMPVGKTVGKVNKKFGYRGTDMRPVLVEDISRYKLNKIFYFGIEKIPRGFYELSLINRSGLTLKHQFTVN